MNTSKRLDYLDMAKGIGMLLVLLGHLQGDAIYSLSPYFHPMCVFIFSFHMPLFFIISGILMKIRDDSSSKELSLKSHISKRFKGIMVPYLWFSLFYFMVVIVAFIKGSIAIQTVLVNLFYVVSCYGMNVLWFLPALFFGEILFIFLKSRLSGKTINIVIPVMAAVTFLVTYLLTTISYDTAVAKRLHEFVTVLLRPLLVCFWIYVGYTLHGFFTSDNYIGRLLSSLDKAISNSKSENREDEQTGSAASSVKSRAIYIITGIVLLAVCAVLSRISNGVDFRSLVFRNVFFYIVCSLLGSYGLILFCKGLPTIKLFTFWGIGSLTFMAVHNSETVLYYALKVSMTVNQYLTHARGYICYAIIVSIILIYTSFMIWIIGRFFPFILGKPFKPFNRKTSNN